MRVRIDMADALIATSFLIISIGLFWTAYRIPDLRAITLGAGAITMIVGIQGAWSAWSGLRTPPDAPVQSPTSVRTPAGPPAAGRQPVTGDEGPESLVVRMGCGVCHQIPGVDAARTGVEGPLLLPAVTAPKRLASPAYRQALQEGRATARSPREYVRESILAPSAFIVPGFEQRGVPDESAMPSHFGAAFTVAALDTLVDYLLTQTCEDAARGGLTGPRIESVESACGERRE